MAWPGMRMVQHQPDPARLCRREHIRARQRADLPRGGFRAIFRPRHTGGTAVSDSGAGLRRTLRILNEEELAEAFNVTLNTVRGWRRTFLGPLGTRIGKSIY